MLRCCWIPRAAKLWADAHNRGLPTGPAEALDDACILAAQALVAATPADIVTIATGNVGHLAQFLDARPWETITP